MSGNQASHIRLDGITKRFSDVIANNDIDLTVKQGSVHALLGENGAGKTTLMNILYGLYQPSAGTVYLNGEAVDFDSPRDALRANIGMIHQHFMLVDTMTVAQNIVLGNELRKHGGLVEDGKRAQEAVQELSQKYGFGIDPTARIDEIGVGEQQRAEIVKALYRGADLLILDEPTAVLTPQEVTDLFQVMNELTEQGKTIIFITHKLGEALEIANDITVLRDGKKIGTVDPNATTEEELAKMMVGEEVLFEVDKDPNKPGEDVISVSSLTVEDDRELEQVHDLDFSVREGEVLGIAGVDGNGQSELVEAIVGLRGASSGRITYRDEPINKLTRRERHKRGMAYIPEDRQERALILEFNLLKNGILGKHHDVPFSRNGQVQWDVVREEVEELIEEFDVRPPDPDALARSLSGGNQQKFVVGREFRMDPDLLVASHPTRGVDIGSIEFIHRQLLELRRDDTAVLLISSKLDEVMQLSDRLAVIYEGEIMAVVDPDDVAEEQVGLLMAGQQPEQGASTKTLGRTVGGDT